HTKSASPARRGPGMRDWGQNVQTGARALDRTRRIKVAGLAGDSQLPGGRFFALFFRGLRKEELGQPKLDPKIMPELTYPVKIVEHVSRNGEILANAERNLKFQMAA